MEAALIKTHTISPSIERLEIIRSNTIGISTARMITSLMEVESGVSPRTRRLFWMARKSKYMAIPGLRGWERDVVSDWLIMDYADIVPLFANT